MSDTGKKIRNRNVPEDKWNDSACKGCYARGTMRHTYLRVRFFSKVCTQLTRLAADDLKNRLAPVWFEMHNMMVLITSRRTKKRGNGTNYVYI